MHHSINYILFVISKCEKRLSVIFLQQSFLTIHVIRIHHGEVLGKLLKSHVLKRFWPGGSRRADHAGCAVEITARPKLGARRMSQLRKVIS